MSVKQNTAAGKAMLMIIGVGVDAEIARNLIRERVKTSLQTRERKGLINGRSTTNKSTLETAKKSLEARESDASATKPLTISRSGFYNYFPVD